MGDLGPGWSAIFGVIAGGGISWLIAKSSHGAEDRRQEKQHDYERQSDAEHLRQQRLAACYETVLSAVSRTTEALRHWQFGQEPPALISDDELDEYLVKAALFGSDAVTERLRAWAKITGRLTFVIQSLAILENRPEGGRDAGWHAEQGAYRNESWRLQERITEATEAVVHQMREELGT